MAEVKRAILSCHDKTGVVDLAKVLRNFNVEIISTAGTLNVLKDSGVEAISIEEFTGVREMMSGRVKSLHPKIHAGLLGIRDNKLHVEEMQAYECQWIDMVVVNLRPLDELFAQSGIALEEALDQIDIGGTAMLRSAAKNFRYVTVVVNPDDYSKVEHELRAHDGAVTFATKHRLAKEAFACAAHYDQSISEYMKNQEHAGP